MANSMDDKTKSNSPTLSVTATPAESPEYVPSRNMKKVVLRGMIRRFSVSMPSEPHSDTDFIIWCPPEHSMHPALDKLGLVITGRTDEGVAAMERNFPIEWRYDGVIKLWVSTVLHSRAWLIPRLKTTGNGSAHVYRTSQGF